MTQQRALRSDSLLLLGDTDSLTPAAGGLGVLTTDTDAPGVTETTVNTDLLQALEVLTHFVVKTVGQNLGELSVLEILLPVEEPVGDLVLAGVLHNGHDTLDLLVGELTGPLEGVDVSLLADKV